MKRMMAAILFFAAAVFAGAQSGPAPVPTVQLANLPDLLTAGVSYAGVAATYDTQLRGNFVTLAEQANAAAAAINDLQTRVAGAASAAPRSASIGYTISLKASDPVGCSAVPGFLKAASSSAYYNTNLTFGQTPFFCDYKTDLPAGTYTAAVRMATTSGSAPVTFHLELPAGTPFGDAFTYTPASTGYFVAAINGSVSMGAGAPDLRLSVDAPGASTYVVDWVRLTKTQ